MSTYHVKQKVSLNDKYLIDGDLMARNFTISKNHLKIAQVNKVMFSFKDSYKIDIFEDKDELLCLSLLIAIDNSIHN
ncbi:MAG: LURP-one-related family protein [Clostridium sp.]